MHTIMHMCVCVCVTHISFSQLNVFINHLLRYAIVILAGNLMLNSEEHTPQPLSLLRLTLSLPPSPSLPLSFSLIVEQLSSSSSQMFARSKPNPKTIRPPQEKNACVCVCMSTMYTQT